MAVIRSAPTLLDHTPVTATQDINLMLMEEDVSFPLIRLHQINIMFHGFSGSYFFSG